MYFFSRDPCILDVIVAVVATLDVWTYVCEHLHVDHLLYLCLICYVIL